MFWITSQSYPSFQEVAQNAIQARAVRAEAPRISVFSAPLKGVDFPRRLDFVMSKQASSLNLVLCGVGAALLAGVLLRRRHSLPLPPGPPSLPTIGGLLSMPSEQEWLTFAEWGRKYSTSTVPFSYRVLTSVQATFARSPSSVRP